MLITRPFLGTVDVEGQVLLRHLEPSSNGYRAITEHRAPALVAARLLPAACVELATLFSY
jgi:hypothetical protein